MAPSFRTMAQLRHQTWKTREAAVKELKRNAFKDHGADYEIGETSPGTWMVIDRSEADASASAPKVTKLPERPARGVKKSPQKKAADAAKRKAGKAEHAGDAKHRELIAQATGFTVHFRKNPAEAFNEEAATIAEAMAIRDRLNAEHGQGGRRAMIYAKQAKGAAIPIYEDMLPKTEAETKAPASEEPAAEPQNDLSPLPAGQDYYLRIDWPQFSLLEGAASVAQLRCETPLIVKVVGAKDGKVHRTIDGRIGAPARQGRASRRSTGAARAPRTPRAPISAERAKLNEEIVRLAKRKGGVKRTEMSALNGGVALNWKQILQNLGKREGLDVKVDREGETPVYWLVKA